MAEDFAASAATRQEVAVKDEPFVHSVKSIFVADTELIRGKHDIALATIREIGQVLYSPSNVAPPQLTSEYDETLQGHRVTGQVRAYLGRQQ